VALMTERRCCGCGKTFDALAGEQMCPGCERRYLEAEECDCWLCRLF
jgi:hypothetical protein